MESALIQQLLEQLGRTSWEQYLAVIIPAYLLGSIPFGLILTKLAGLGDIRNTGSGNIGATNVLRTGKKWLAALTLLMDMLKGLIAVYIVPFILIFLTKNLNEAISFFYLAGLSALIGHIFPIWLKFKGGKGVATFFGIAVILPLVSASTMALTWLLIFFLTGYSSLAALTAVLVVMLQVSMSHFNYQLISSLEFLAFSLSVLLIIWAHRQNISRLLKGQENRFSFRKKKENAS